MNPMYNLPFSPTKAFQWAQLLTVTFIHFSVDMFAGAIPALLPQIQADFHIRLGVGTTLVFVMHTAANGIQLVTGHLRGNKTTPFFLPVGLAMSITFCLISTIIHIDSAITWMFAITLISGIGIGLIHPEAFRVIHYLNEIPASISTAMLSMGGVLGYGMGAWISTELFRAHGYNGLWFLVPGVVILMLAIFILKIRLAVEDSNEHEPQPGKQTTLSFWPIWFMTIPACMATSTLMGFLPIQLSALGYVLDFGGFSVMIFVSGAAAGTIFWGWFSRNKNIMTCCSVSLLLGVPFLFSYPLFMAHKLSVWLLFPGGFFVMSAYSLMVTEARFARGLNLGGRMAFASGGTWGIASLTFVLLGFLADKYTWGVEHVIKWTWTGYLLSAIIGVYVIRQMKKEKKEAIV